MAAWLEQAWMERYLNRELSESESDWFEAYLLERPELLGELRADNLARRLPWPIVKSTARRWYLAGVGAAAALAMALVLPAWRGDPDWSSPEVVRVEQFRNGPGQTFDVHLASEAPTVLFEILGPPTARILNVDVRLDDGSSRRIGPVQSENGAFLVLMERAEAQRIAAMTPIFEEPK
jgi:hypothetical protein